MLYCRPTIKAFPVTQMVKSLPAMQETRDQSLGREDSLEKGMATHTSILARRIPWTEELGGLQSMGSERVRHDWVTKHPRYSGSPNTEQSLSAGQPNEMLQEGVSVLSINQL